MRALDWIPGRWWGIVFPAAGAVGAFLVAGSDAEAHTRVAGYVAAAAIGLGWLLLARWAGEDQPLSPLYMAVLVVAIAVIGSIDPNAAFLQVVAYPYAWWYSDRIDRIVIANVAVAGAIVTGFSAYGGREVLWTGIVTALASLAFSFAMGLWITTIARNAAEHARMQAKLDAMGGELAAAHRDAGAAAERERFAHEIHDTLTQTLTAVVMLTERAGGELVSGNREAATTAIGQAERTAREALAETRSLIAEGSGVGIDAAGLKQSIARLSDRFADETGIRVTRRIDGDLDGLDRADQVVLLRCLQETLANVRKHARSSSVAIELVTTGTEVRLSVTDDGVGFPDAIEAASARGYGLAGMASRLALSSGRLAVTSGDGGTRVSVHLPRDGGTDA